MKLHLERALCEICYANAEFELGRARKPARDVRAAEKIDGVIVLLRLSQWGLETALRCLRDVDVAPGRQRQ